MRESIIQDFITFSNIYININDADPMYPVLKTICDRYNMDLEQRIEFCFWYMAWYNLRSALEAYEAANGHLMITPEMAKLPIKLERRGLRGGTNIIRHWDDQLRAVRHAGGWVRWAEQGFWRTTPKESALSHKQWNWLVVSRTIQQVWNNGRWAAYKGAELLEKVCGLELSAPDCGHADSSNPRKGLYLLYDNLPDKDDNKPAAIGILDQKSNELMSACMLAGVPLSNDLALLETCLCGFYSLHRGDYYLGCDIDLMLEVACQQDDGIKGLILEARKGVFPEEYLGEVQGWTQHDKPRLTLYRDQGIIATRA